MEGSRWIYLAQDESVFKICNISNEFLLPVSMQWFCGIFWWSNVNQYFFPPAFTSTPTSLIATRLIYFLCLCFLLTCSCLQPTKWHLMHRPEPSVYNSVSALRGHLHLLLAYSTKEFQSNDVEEAPSLKKYRNWLEKISNEFYGVSLNIILFSLYIFTGTMSDMAILR